MLGIQRALTEDGAIKSDDKIRTSVPFRISKLYIFLKTRYFHSYSEIFEKQCRFRHTSISFISII